MVHRDVYRKKRVLIPLLVGFVATAAALYFQNLDVWMPVAVLDTLMIFWAAESALQ